MTVTTVEVPANVADPKVWNNVWNNLIYQLASANGIVVVRGLGQAVWHKHAYYSLNDVWSEVCEVVDSRPMFIINIAKGDVRSHQVALAAMADVSLATPD